MEYFIADRWIKGKSLVGTVKNASDKAVVDYLKNRPELVLSNGIVVHAIPRLIDQITQAFGREQIHPAKQRPSA